MKRLTIVFFLLAVTSGCAQSNEPNMNEEQAYIDKMASNMREASLWVVQHGIESYTQGGKEAIERKLMDEWAGQLWVDPSVGTARDIALFQIKGRGIYCDIQCLSRISSDAVFEYWHVMLTGKDWAGVGKRCMFIVTQTNRVDGVRKIVHQSDSFFPSYKVRESVTVQLPLDDLQLLYKLKAWQFPECFPDSDLKNWEIGIERDGRYVRVRAKR